VIRKRNRTKPKAAPRKFSEAQLEYISRLAATGASRTQLARHLKVSTSMIFYWLSPSSKFYNPALSAAWEQRSAALSAGDTLARTYSEPGMALDYRDTRRFAVFVKQVLKAIQTGGSNGLTWRHLCAPTSSFFPGQHTKTGAALEELRRRGHVKETDGMPTRFIATGGVV
jgi:hypothetical protein